MAKGLIGFALLSNPSDAMASTRIAVLNMLPYLAAAGYRAEIFFEPAEPNEQPDVSGLSDRMVRSGVAVACFQKIRGASVLHEVRSLARRGIRTVYIVCDFVDNEMAAACDATVVVTDFLRSLYAPELQHKIHVVHDGIEHPELRKNSYGVRANRRDKLRAVLVVGSPVDRLPIIGAPPSFVNINVVGRYPLADAPFGHLREAYRKLRHPSEGQYKRQALEWLFTRPFRKINWNISSVYDEMLQADIGIIPAPVEAEKIPGLSISSWQVKSENRLTMKMALGLPVIASPVPSYLSIINQGRNGYIASTRGEWFECFEELRDPRRREAIGRAAREAVIEKYSKEEQARLLVGVLNGIRHSRPLHVMEAR